jgi:transcription-repair coupling factor (superfamily II helicase)
MPPPAYISPLNPVVPAAPGERSRWSRLHGAALGLAVTRASTLHPGPIVVITPDTPTAERLEEQVRFFGEGAALPLLHLPDWETLPYDLFSPHQDIISERLATLYQLPVLACGVLIVPVTTLMVRIAPRAYLEGSSLMVEKGQRLDMDNMRRRLEGAGYRCVSQVMEHGEFAVRGSVFDLYPMGSALPFRLDLFDDEVDNIRTFDPETQRSQERANAVRLLPAREFPLTEEAIAHFRQNWRAGFEGDPTGCPTYRDVSQGLAPAGIEYYLPLFFEQTHTVFDYFPEDCTTVVLEGVHDSAEAFWAEVGERYEQGRHDRERPLLPPDVVFLQTGEVFGALKHLRQVTVGAFEEEAARGVTSYATRMPTPVPIDARASDPLGLVKRFIGDFDGRVLFVAETGGRRETLLETFGDHGMKPRVFGSWSEFLDGDVALGITVAPLEAGAFLEEPRLAIITESLLFGERAMQRRRRKPSGKDAEGLIRDLTELSTGAPVVHEDHGVGRYLGLQTLSVGNVTTEFLALEYADGDKLYVPVSSLNLISR